MLRHRLPALCAAVVLHGCADPTEVGQDLGPASGVDDPVESSTDTEGCDVIREDPCWSRTMQELAACEPDIFDWAALADDGLSCDFEQGSSIEFADPVELPLRGDESWDFRLFVDGQQCAHVVSVSGANADSGIVPGAVELAVTTAAGTTVRRYADGAMTSTCPDGETYSVSQRDANSCADRPDLLASSAVDGSDFSLNLSGPGEDDFSIICGDFE